LRSGVVYCNTITVDGASDANRAGVDYGCARISAVASQSKGAIAEFGQAIVIAAAVNVAINGKGITTDRHGAIATQDYGARPQVEIS